MSPNSSARTQIDQLPYESFETPYVRMVFEADQVPWQHNVLASAAHWILLAGYLVVPGTFTSLQKSGAVQDELMESEAGELILDTIQNPPLLATACFFFVAGLMIMAWLYHDYCENYIWLINRIFMPTLLNALAGLLSTIISLYTAHDGDWSIMALLTVIASGLSVATASGLLIIYKFGKLKRLKQEHILIVSSGGRTIPA
ncbi:hypothetical protein PENSTE_c023G09054 [Penicillium steckii]|uniref:Uncharacterized protein n=1 Tax=Penicillium steckii TaxID=303698 RepID=A0A1V6SRV9_9EURO|nr:hypothetical protein PENSTE_c023G09054 [Penicillium steckii]